MPERRRSVAPGTVSPLYGMAPGHPAHYGGFGTTRVPPVRGRRAVEAKLPAHVEEFIANNLDSVEMLDVLLLVRRHRDRAWIPEQVSERLYTTPRSAANRLEALAACGLVTVKEDGAHAAYTYSPRSGELERVAADLEQAYSTRRITVINLIFSKPSAHLRTFADAFRIRGEG
jgi:hypothetical protein